MTNIFLKGYHIEEPMLIFGRGEEAPDQKTGLIFFGPYHMPDLKKSTPENINLGIIGSGKTIQLTIDFINKINKKIQSDEENKFYYPDFLGFSEIFNCEFILSKSWQITVTQREIENVIKIKDINIRIKKAADLFSDKIKLISVRDPKPTVIICALPKKINDFCGISELTKGKRAIKLTSQEKKHLELVEEGQTFLTDREIGDGEEDTKLSDKAENLRSILKAHTMKFDIPIQIINLETLTFSKQKQPPATIAWNICTGLYYKAGGHPWRLSNFGKDVCYIGIQFYKEIKVADPKHRTAISQIFTEYGDSLIFRGETIAQEKGKAPHLTTKGANEIIEKSLKLYNEQIGRNPQRIVIHKSSKYSTNELRAFKEASEEVREIDLVAFGDVPLNFVRSTGKWPPLRGTVIEFPPNRALLFTNGYSHMFGTYPGAKIPKPIWISEHFGDSSMKNICEEILALTKMDWNHSKSFTRKPITQIFPHKVGKILKEIPDDYVFVKQDYRFYM